MKTLVHVNHDGNYVVWDDISGRIITYSEKDILSLNEPVKNTYIDAHNFVIVDYIDKFRCEKIYIISSLVSYNRKVGYIVYIPHLNNIKYLTRKETVDSIFKYGVINGKVENRSLVGDYPKSDASKYKQIFMSLYKERNSEEKVEKIVRSEKDSIELRYLAPFTAEDYSVSVGVDTVNLKWWTIRNNEMEVLKRPSVRHLDISKYVKEIKYNGVGRKYELGLQRHNISLGAFANWNLEEVTLGKGLNVIGREAFYNNMLTKLSIPEYIRVIDEKAFMNNMLDTLYFNNKCDMCLGKYAFANNNLRRLHIPSHIISIEEGCFSGNTSLDKVSFDEKSKIKVLKKNVFQHCSFKYIELPVSIKEVEDGAFDGCENLRVICVKKASKLNSKSFVSQMRGKGITVMVV